jgi:AcrR family transcriptional regulator
MVTGMEQSVAPRRSLAGRPGSTTEHLLDATVDELREVGYDRLTVRSVCRRADLTHATVYGYFSSKPHLVSEAYWRHLQRWPDAVAPGTTAADRVATTCRDLALLLGADPALGAAATVAVLSTDPDVTRLRSQIGALIQRRLRAAIGTGADESFDDAVDVLTMAINGAMVQAGLGHINYDEMARRLARAAAFVLRDAP